MEIRTDTVGFGWKLPRTVRVGYFRERPVYKPISTVLRGLHISAVYVVLRLAIAVLLLLYAASNWWLALSVARLMHFNDFGRFYYSLQQWRAGGSLYDSSPATWVQIDSHGVHLWNLNPPHFALVIWPLSGIAIEPAFTAWLALNFAALVICGAIVAQTLDVRLSWSAWILVVAAAAASAPILSQIVTGQVGGLLAWLLTCVWREARAGRWRRAAILIGLAWSLKLFLAPLMIYLAGRREWRSVAVAAGSGFACFAIGVAVFGWTEHARWFQVLREVQWPWLVMNSSIFGPVTRAAFVLSGASVDALSTRAAMGIALAAAVPLLLMGVTLATRCRNVDHGMLLLVQTCIAVSPVGWIYYWPMFVGPLTVCVRSDRLIRRAFLWSLPGWFVPMWWLWPLRNVFFAVTIASIYTWTLLLLWFAAYRSATAQKYGERPAGPPRPSFGRPPLA